MLNCDTIINKHQVFVEHYESKIKNISTGYMILKIQIKILMIFFSCH